MYCWSTISYKLIQRWLSNSEHALLLQRTWVVSLVPVHTSGGSLSPATPVTEAKCLLALCRYSSSHHFFAGTQLILELIILSLFPQFPSLVILCLSCFKPSFKDLFLFFFYVYVNMLQKPKMALILGNSGVLQVVLSHLIWLLQTNLWSCRRKASSVRWWRLEALIGFSEVLKETRTSSEGNIFQGTH